MRKIKYVIQNKEISVSLLRKTKKRYYENLKEKSVVDSKLFWKTVKPLLSDKIMAKDHIHLVENDELIKTDLETAEVFNNFFSNIVQNLKISRYTNEEPIVSNINDPTLKAILKYRNHSSITAMLEKWKRSIDNGKMFGALLTDLSKAFDCIDHELLIAKLNPYGFSLTALKLMHSYLSNRKQRTKINSSYSSWLEIIFGVPQG